MPDLTDCSDLSITAIQTDLWGCGMYRVGHPMEVLRRHGARVFISVMDTGIKGQRMKVLHDDILHGSEFVLLQRTVNPSTMEWIEEYERKYSRKLIRIYECDDDLLRVDPKNPSAHHRMNPGEVSSDPYGKYTPQVCRQIERNVRACAALFVSTPDLAARWAHLNNRVFVLPNSIDFSMRQWERKEERQVGKPGDVVIGWGGGKHHMGDEEPLVGVLPDILRRYPQAHLALCSNPIVATHFLGRWGMGDTKWERDGIKFKGYEEFAGRYSRIDGVSFAEWPFVLKQFDVGLAPLDSSVFNRCKSYLRLIEYGAVGVPYIASKIAPYSQFHQETGGLGGFVCSTRQEWRDALSRLIEDYEQRAVMSAAIAGVVKDSYNTDEVAFRWAAALRAVRDNTVTVSTWTQRNAPGRNQACPCQSGKLYKRCCHPAYG